METEEQERPDSKDIVRRAVATNGFFVTTVFGDSDEPIFAYTIGLYRSFGHPELIMIGDLPPQTLANVVHQLAHRVQAGARYKEWGEDTSLVPGVRHMFLPVLRSKYPDYVGQAMNFYGRTTMFPLLQVVWPNAQGLLPWESVVTESEGIRQPLLGPIPGEKTADDDQVLSPDTDVIALREEHDRVAGDRCAITIFSDGVTWRVGHIHSDTPEALAAVSNRLSKAEDNSLTLASAQLDIGIALFHPIPQPVDWPEIDDVIMQRREGSEPPADPSYCVALGRKEGSWAAASLRPDVPEVDIVRKCVESWPRVSYSGVATTFARLLASILLDPDFPDIAAREGLRTAADVALFETDNWNLERFSHALEEDDEAHESEVDASPPDDEVEAPFRGLHQDVTQSGDRNDDDAFGFLSESLERGYDGIAIWPGLTPTDEPGWFQCLVPTHRVGRDMSFRQTSLRRALKQLRSLLILINFGPSAADETEPIDLSASIRERENGRAIMVLSRGGTGWRPSLLKPGTLDDALGDDARILFNDDLDDALDDVRVIANALGDHRLAVDLLRLQPKTWAEFRQRVMGEGQPPWKLDTDGTYREDDFSGSESALHPPQTADHTQVDLQDPRAVVIESTGQMLVADGTGGKLQRIGPNGEISAAWHIGSGAVLSDVAFADSGMVHVADEGNHCVHVLSPDGEQTGTIGSAGSAFGQLLAPSGVAVGPDGSVFVADAGNHRVQKFSPEGKPLAQWKVRRGKSGASAGPMGVSVDGEGNMYVADSATGKIQKLSPTGKRLASRTIKSGARPARPSAVAEDDRILVADSGQGCVHMFTRNLDPMESILENLHAPSGIAVTTDGDIVVVDGGGKRIMRLAPDGELRASWGQEMPPSGSPRGLCASPDGTLFWTDAEADQVVKVSASGEVIGVWGNHGYDRGCFHAPGAMTVDGTGHIYVVDGHGQRIQKFSATGEVRGEWTSGGLDVIMLRFPYSAAVDSAGNVYVVTELFCSETMAEHRIAMASAKGAPGALNANAYQRRILEKFSLVGKRLFIWDCEPGASDDFSGLTCVAVDGKDNFYLVDAGGITQYSCDGEKLRTFGPKDNEESDLTAPTSVAIHRDGTLYVTDFGSDQIVQLTPEGDVIRRIGTKGSEPGQLLDPYSVAVDSNGSMYVLELGNNRIQRFSSEGESLAIWPLSGKPDEMGYGQRTVAIDERDNVIFTDSVARRIELRSSEWELLDKWTPGTFSSDVRDFSVVADGHGSYYGAATTSREARAYKMTSRGRTTQEWPLARDVDAVGLAVDTDGDIWVADTAGDAVLHLNHHGELKQRIGGWGSEIGRFGAPSGVAIGPDGRVYVADTGNHRIQILSSDGVSMHALDGVHACAIAAGPDNSLYVADDRTRRVYRLASDGTELPLFAGEGEAPSFDAPAGIVVDGNNNLYVLETAHNLIRKFSSAGEEIGRWGSGQPDPSRAQEAKHQKQEVLAERYRNV